LDFLRCDRIDTVFFQERTRIKKFKIAMPERWTAGYRLLILCCGPATKRIEEFKDFDKEYTGTFVLGATTASHDLEKPVDEIHPVEHITDELILNAARSLTGEILQVPPVFSAIKINGKRPTSMPER
jgi:hypothetical protein